MQATANCSDYQKLIFFFKYVSQICYSSLNMFSSSAEPFTEGEICNSTVFFLISEKELLENSSFGGMESTYVQIQTQLSEDTGYFPTGNLA